VLWEGLRTEGYMKAKLPLNNDQTIKDRNVKQVMLKGRY
jgi:hypothetical protein